MCGVNWHSHCIFTNHEREDDFMKKQVTGIFLGIFLGIAMLTSISLADSTGAPATTSSDTQSLNPLNPKFTDGTIDVRSLDLSLGAGGYSNSADQTGTSLKLKAHAYQPIFGSEEKECISRFYSGSCRVHSDVVDGKKGFLVFDLGGELILDRNKKTEGRDRLEIKSPGLSVLRLEGMDFHDKEGTTSEKNPKPHATYDAKLFSAHYVYRDNKTQNTKANAAELNLFDGSFHRAWVMNNKLPIDIYGKLKAITFLVGQLENQGRKTRGAFSIANPSFGFGLGSGETLRVSNEASFDYVITDNSDIREDMLSFQDKILLQRKVKGHPVGAGVTYAFDNATNLDGDNRQSKTHSVLGTVEMAW